MGRKLSAREKLTRELNDIFGEADHGDNIVFNDITSFADYSHVYGFVPKTDDMKAFLLQFNMVRRSDNKMDQYAPGDGARSVYCEIPSYILALVKEGVIKITVDKDRPLIIENDEIKILVAPRVVDDEDEED